MNKETYNAICYLLSFLKRNFISINLQELKETIEEINKYSLRLKKLQKVIFTDYSEMKYYFPENNYGKIDDFEFNTPSGYLEKITIVKYCKKKYNITTGDWYDTIA